MYLKRLNQKRGQVWVETVIYTLIGLTIIGLLLAMAIPKLNEQKDKALIEQAISGLGIVDQKVYETLSGTGNKRKIELKIGKGIFTINSKNNQIIWELDSNYQYSEAGRKVNAGKINVTTELGSPYRIFLELSYPMDIRFEGGENSKQIGRSSTSHFLTVENQGVQNGKTVINFELV